MLAAREAGKVSVWSCRLLEREEEPLLPCQPEAGRFGERRGVQDRPSPAPPGAEPDRYESRADEKCYYSV